MISVKEFGVDDAAFQEQVTGLTQRITTELNKLEQLLLAGMVDRRVLVNFREAVNRIRTTSWSVQQSLEPGGEAALPTMLLKERMRIIEQLANQLAGDLDSGSMEVGKPEVGSLEKALESLSAVLLRRTRI